MNTTRRFALTLIALLATAAALAAKPLAGPKGGKIVTTAAPHVEFFVEKDRTVTVSFYDKDLKPVPVSDQVLSAVAETKAGRVNLVFAAREGALVSSAPLPEGEGYRIVLQVRPAAQARPTNYRIEYHDEMCPECNRAEYACICEDAEAHKAEH